MCEARSNADRAGLASPRLPRGLTGWLALGGVFLFPGAAPAQAPGGETGRIEGVAVIGPSLAARKTRFRLYSHYGPGSQPAAKRPAAGNELGHLVIYLDSVPPTAAPAPAGSGRLAIEQINETFVPHVLPVARGSTVAFPNGDPFFHNVFSLSATHGFDLGRYPKGASKSVRFDRGGVVQTFCHIHSDMSAVILVLANPFFTVPDSSGRFSLDGIPAGEYRIVAWHERIKPIVRTVRVIAGHTTRVEYAIPLPQEDARSD